MCIGDNTYFIYYCVLFICIVARQTRRRRVARGRILAVLWPSAQRTQLALFVGGGARGGGSDRVEGSRGGQFDFEPQPRMAMLALQYQ